MIIGLSGKKGSGKSYYTSYIIKTYNFIELSFAYPLKKSLELILNLSYDELYGEKKDSYNNQYHCYNRELMQWLGTEVFREEFNKKFNYNGSVWVDNVKNIILQNPNKNYVISDVRFLNEIEMIKSLNGIIINIKDNNINQDNHKSENQKLIYDYQIINLKTLENTLSNYTILDNIINK